MCWATRALCPVSVRHRCVGIIVAIAMAQSEQRWQGRVECEGIFLGEPNTRLANAAVSPSIGHEDALISAC